VSDRFLLSASVDRSVIIWDKQTGEQVHRITSAHGKAVNGLAVCGNLFLTASQADGTVKIWEFQT
jgi:WD40 repeat protein